MDFKDLKDIKALTKILVDSGLTALEISLDSGKIRLERNAVCVAENARVAEEITAPYERPAKTAKKISDDGTIDFNRIVELKSPMIGIFYASPSPDVAPFVTVGSRVKKGDTLCIIEAMKVMNEITADCDGEIVDVCVSNGQVVEFSQVLFKIF